MPTAATLPRPEARPSAASVPNDFGVKYGMAAYVGAKEVSGQKIFTFRWTDETEDRDGEVLTSDGWILEHFERNPVVLDCHPEIRGWEQGIESILGHCLLPLRREGTTWEVDIVFSQSPKGRIAEQLVEEGSLRAVSAGYMPLKKERTPGQPTRVVQKELWEISMAPVPSNRNTLRVRAATVATEEPERPVPTKALDFNQSMAQMDLSERKWEMNRALHESLDSIIADKEMDYDAKMSAANSTCAQYHVAMMSVFAAAMGPRPVQAPAVATAPDADTKAGAKLSQSSKAEMEAACGEMKQAMDCMMGARDRLMKMMAPTDDHPEEHAEDTAGKAAPVEETPAAEPESPATQEVLEPEAKNLDGLATAVSAFAALLKKE